MKKGFFHHDAARTILEIAIPAIGDSYLQNLIGVVDMFFVAKLGLLAIDAVGVTNIYTITYIAVFIAISTALSVFLAQAVGKKDTNTCHAVLRHSLLLCTATGLLLSLISIIFSSPLLHLMGAYGQLEQTAIPYFVVVLGVSPLIALFTAESAAFRAMGDAKTPFRIGIEMNGVHLVLDYVLIFGPGPIPALHLTGAALAMVMARMYGFIRLWVKAKRVPALSIGIHALRLDISLLVRLIRFGVPAALERLFMRLGQIIYFGLIVRMGIGAYAAHNIAGSMTIFASTIGNGFAAAAISAIGIAVGSKQTQKIPEYRRWSYRLSAFAMTGVTAILCAASPLAGHLFTQNNNVIHLLTIVLAIDIVSQPFLAAVLIDTSAIQASGNSLYPMIVTAVGIWGIRTTGVILFGVKLGLGLPAVWASIAADNAFRAFLFARYRKKNLVYET